VSVDSAMLTSSSSSSVVGPSMAVGRLKHNFLTCVMFCLKYSIQLALLHKIVAVEIVFH